MAETLRFAGVPIYLNGRNYYIPSLSTKAFRAYCADLVAPPVDSEDPTKSFDRYIPIIGVAIRRNYPDVTDDQLEEWLDLHTFRLAIRAVQDASGMEPVTAGE